MAKPSFSAVWNRVQGCVGQTFTTKKGLPFTYKMGGDILVPSRTKYDLTRSEFEKAYQIVPFDGPGVINWRVRGPAYVWAILHDRRISQGQW